MSERLHTVVCAQCTAEKAVSSSTDHCSDISHLLPLDTISTETFLSHLLFVKAFTELCHIWAGCLGQARHISQAVNLQSNTNNLPISLRGWGLHQKHKATSGLIQKAFHPIMIVIVANIIYKVHNVEGIIDNCPVKLNHIPNKIP